MQPAITTLIMFIVIGVVSFVTVVGVALIALGSSGAFSSKGSHVRTITSTVRTTTMISTITTTTTTTTNTTNTTVVTRSLNAALLNIIGSSDANFALYQNYSGPLSLRTPDESILSELADTDGSSKVFETQRTQYLYFVLSNTNSSASSRSLLFPAAVQSTGRSFMIFNDTINITHIIIHFGPSTNNESAVLIPLPNSMTSATQPSQNEITAFTTTNGTTVIRLRITIPNDTCSTSNQCLSLEYQAYAIVSSSSITKVANFNVSVACGNVCSLSNSPCYTSCNNTCNSGQSLSNATIVTRRYTMNSTGGTFQFNYSMPNTEQQIKVYNGESLIFNTNCTQTNDSRILTYNSTSSLIRVDVEPNYSCQNTTGNVTSLSFTVGCS